MAVKQAEGKFRYFVFLIASVAVILLSLEGFGQIYVHFKYGSPGKSYGIWQYDAELGAIPRPNSYNSLTALNDHGLRNRENVFDPKPKNGLRVIAFGGSTTFGYNLQDSETYTEKLQQQLRALPGQEKAQVLNAGVITYSAGQNALYMKRLIPKLKPDYAIIYEGVNEVLNAFLLERDGVSFDSLTGKYAVISKSNDQNRWLKRHSVLMRLLDYYAKSWVNQKREAEESFEDKAIAKLKVHPWVFENYRFLLSEMIDYLKSEGVKPIVVRYEILGDPYQKRVPEIAAEVARSKNVLVCDMISRFQRSGEKPQNLFIKTGAHVTPKGAALLADELYQVITLDLKKA